MAASTVKSTKVTNDLDSIPRVVEPAGKQGLAGLRPVMDTHEAATASIDEVGDVILMMPVQSSWRLHDLILRNDDLDSGGTAGAVNIGLYNGPETFRTSAGTTYGPYAVIDADCFASAVTTLTAANTVGLSVRYEAGGTYDEIAKVGNKLWEVLNLPEDPSRTFVVGLTVTTQMTTPVAGTITLTGYVSD